MNPFLEGLLGDYLGLNSDQLNQVNAQIPTIQKLIDLFVANEALINQFKLLYDQAQPGIDQALTDWQQIAPTVQMVVDAVSKKLNPTS
jgi:hypothetical protein